MGSDPAAAALDEAIRRLAARHSGEWSEADAMDLQAWLAESRTNQSAYDQVNRAWLAAAQVSRMPSGRRHGWHRFAIPSARAPAVIALTVMLVALGWHLGATWWNGKVIRTVTARGQPRELVLSDGTRVYLEARSELLAQIGAHARRVSLLQGEARFVVTHDESRPFSVRAGPGQITDAGTSFDVEMLPEGVGIRIIEGAVGVKTASGSLQLTAGQRSGYDLRGVLDQPIESRVAANAWIDGLRLFEAEALADVVERFARYHEVEFTFADPAARRVRVSGSFRVRDLDSFLSTLRTAFPIEVRRPSPTRIELAYRRPGSQA